MENMNIYEFTYHKYGYHPVTFTPGLWMHESNGISFTLVVDNFGIKHASIESLHHLINVLEQYYNIALNYNRDPCVGVTLDWI